MLMETIKTSLLIGVAVLLMSCSGQKEFKMGSYGYDAKFLKDNGIKYAELVSADGSSKVMVIPAWQGRVMTTSASGDEGSSYGWINYRFIREGKVSKQFNPVGGEERLWLGPEGGPFSLYFKSPENQVYENWVVPTVFDTESFNVRSQDKKHIHFEKEAHLTNASGTVFDINIDRTITLMTSDEVTFDFGITLSDEMKMVAYKTDNKITNIGKNAWTEKSGLVSVWMLGMFNPTPTTTVFIPYKMDAQGPIVNDEYFGKIPANRLTKENGIIYFKIDGKYRSKLGLPANRAMGLCGSYDSSKGVLTILWCSLPKTPVSYVNGQWGSQKDPFAGDVINSYNDGPIEDGSIMGPFYEIETSSPGAELAPGTSLVHTQKIVHIQGTERQLSSIVKSVFNADLKVIESKFQ